MGFVQQIQKTKICQRNRYYKLTPLRMQEQGEGAGVIRSLKKGPWKAESEGMHRDQLFNCVAKINTLHNYITPLKAGLKSQSPGRSKSTGMFTGTSEQEKATLPRVPVTLKFSTLKVATEKYGLQCLNPSIQSVFRR